MERRNEDAQGTEADNKKLLRLCLARASFDKPRTATQLV